jgi:ribosomal protein S27AE
MAEDPKVVDLNSRRLDKALQDHGTVRVVQLLACSNCSSSHFKLTHDNLVACGECNLEIPSLRWYDVNLPMPSPTTPA